jgi:hypothetical protein
MQKKSRQKIAAQHIQSITAQVELSTINIANQGDSPYCMIIPYLFCKKSHIATVGGIC